MVWEYFTHFHKSALCYNDVHVYCATSQEKIKTAKMQKKEEVKPYSVLARTYRYNLNMLRTTMFFYFQFLSDIFKICKIR